MSTLVVNVDEGSCANSSNENSMEHSTDSPAVTSLTPNSNPTSHLNSSSIDRDDPIQYECENHAENTTAATNCNSSYAASRDDDNKHVTVDRYGFIVDTEGENRNSFHQKLAMSKKINEER